MGYKLRFDLWRYRRAAGMTGLGLERGWNLKGRMLEWRRGEAIKLSRPMGL
jgi:hypothetical protein